MAAPQVAFLGLVLVQEEAAVAYLATAVEPALEVAAEVAAGPEETVGTIFLAAAAAAQAAPSSMVQEDLTIPAVRADFSVVVQAGTSGAMAMVVPAPAAEAVE